MRAILALLVLTLAAACGQPAQHAPAAAPAVPQTGMSISDAWAAPTPGGVDVSAGYVTIINNTTSDDRLISAVSARARAVELHDMTMDEQMVMQMRQLDGVDIPAGGMAIFGPGGKHIMFNGVFPPFAEGDEIPLTLNFEHAGAVNTTLPVRRSPPGH